MRTFINMKSSDQIEQEIKSEFAKVPARMRGNFLVRAAINSREEIGLEGVLDQLKDINKYLGRKSVEARENTTETKLGLKGHVRAGKKAGPVNNPKRKAN